MSWIESLAIPDETNKNKGPRQVDQYVIFETALVPGDVVTINLPEHLCAIGSETEYKSVKIVIDTPDVARARLYGVIKEPYGWKPHTPGVKTGKYIDAIFLHGGEANKVNAPIDDVLVRSQFRIENDGKIHSVRWEQNE